jgi:hypothetical protein
LRVIHLLLKTIGVYIWRVYLGPLGPHRGWVLFVIGFFAVLVIREGLQEDQMDRDFNGAGARTCTFWTRTYPMRQFAIYAVGEGEKQYMRMDQFVSGATGRQAEYIIVNSGITYVWNTWNKNPKEGVKFANAPVPFMEYFSVDSIKHKDFRCDSWKPEKGMFFVPGYITFKTVSVEEFVRDEMYTAVLKTYIRESALE